jgi:hypothetical protein
MYKAMGGMALTVALWAAPLSGEGDLRLSIANGRVTVVAQDVSLRQILDEWARVGGTKIVGAERLAGPMVTLELQDVPEGKALETLLRSASGYIAKPRVGTVGASSFDRILIMPPSRAPAMSAAPPQFNTTRTQPTMPPLILPPNDMDEANQVMPPGAMQGEQRMPYQPPAQPGFQPGPQPNQTVSRPGMLPPPAPTVPGNPYKPNPEQPIVVPPGGMPDRPSGRGGGGGL